MQREYRMYNQFRRPVLAQGNFCSELLVDRKQARDVNGFNCSVLANGLKS